MPPPPSPFPRGSGGCVLYPGTKVMLHGLKDGNELNNKEGICENWDALSGRMAVKLQDGTVKSIKTINMRKVVEPDSDEDLEEDPQYNRVLKVFQQYDANGDGVLDRQEFEKCLLGLGLSKAVLGSFLVNVDKSGDMEVQYAEFVKWAMAPAGKKTKKNRMDVYWPEKTQEHKEADEVDGDEHEEPALDVELTLQDVERICRESVEDWPPHALTVLNNMRHRFPEYPVEGIVWRMRKNDFVGGKVMAAIRSTGAKEVELVPPSAVKVGLPGSFPWTYQNRSYDKPLKVYNEGGKDWSFYNMRDSKIDPCGEIPAQGKFKVTEVKRGNEFGFCFGRIEYAGNAKDGTYWTVLGLEVNRTHWTTNDQTRSKNCDLSYTDAQRCDS